jgi:hypothetical protein
MPVSWSQASTSVAAVFLVRKSKPTVLPAPPVLPVQQTFSFGDKTDKVCIKVWIKKAVDCLKVNFSGTTHVSKRLSELVSLRLFRAKASSKAERSVDFFDASFLRFSYESKQNENIHRFGNSIAHSKLRDGSKWTTAKFRQDVKSYVCQRRPLLQ